MGATAWEVRRTAESTTSLRDGLGSPSYEDGDGLEVRRTKMAMGRGRGGGRDGLGSPSYKDGDGLGSPSYEGGDGIGGGEAVGATDWEVRRTAESITSLRDGLGSPSYKDGDGMGSLLEV